MKDILSFLIGLMRGKRHVILDEANNYTFTDENSDGNIVITEAE